LFVILFLFIGLALGEVANSEQLELLLAGV
jgi:hypothetical protein